MAEKVKPARAGLWWAVMAFAVVTVYLIALLSAEKQQIVMSLIAFGIVSAIAAGWFGVPKVVARAFSGHEDRTGLFAIVAALVIAAWFHEDHFVLLLTITVFL